MSKNKQCPSCLTGRLERRIKAVTHELKGRSIVLKQPGAWCSFCDEGFLNGDDIRATEAELKTFRKRVKSEMAAPYKRIRKKLKLSQKEAALICGGGPNAFSRYERGEVDPPLATQNLLKLLDKHPELLKEIYSQ